MTVAIIGSVALEAHGIKLREAGDLDLVGSYKGVAAWIRRRYRGRIIELFPIEDGKKLYARIKDGPIIEADLTWGGTSHVELLDLIKQDCEEVDGTVIATPNICYMLKMSHRFRKNNPHFNKTRKDIAELRSRGCVIEARHKEFYTRRVRETLDYSHPSLNRSKANFFSDDGVGYVHDHDTIHLAVMLRDKPAYEFFKADAAEVLCSKDLFNALPQDIKVSAVYEESCVLAIERSLVPYPGVKTPEEAFLFALEKVCTSITSGWFRTFAWENYDAAVEMFRANQGDDLYWNRFQVALSEGRIAPYMAEAA
jgi:hypothetical protein